MPPVSFAQKKHAAAMAAARAKVEHSTAAKEAKQKLINAFSVFDINNDGYVEEDELIRILTRDNTTAMSKEDAKDFITHFQSFDKNGDGKLSIEEFATALASVRDIQKQRAAMKAKTDEAAAQFKAQMKASAALAT